MLIRRENPGDAAVIAEVTTAAFTRHYEPGRTPPEAGLVDELRQSTSWLPHLSLVATTKEGRIIGHVLGTRGHVDSTPALALGPLSVHPDHQRDGVGSALMHTFLGAADAMDEPLVALLGDPHYYQRFGFRLSDGYHIRPPVPEWQPHFQVRPLTAYSSALQGTFTYPEPFDHV